MTQAGWGGADPVQVGDTASYEMGTEYLANVDITVTHIRVFSGDNARVLSNRRGRIWSIAGTVLAQAIMPDSLPQGWQLYALISPLPLTAGTRFIVSFSTGGNYAAIPNVFQSAAVVSSDGAVTARKAIDALNGNGVFNSSPGPGSFPTSNFNSTFYGIDLGYDVGISGNTAPVIDNITVGASGLNVSVSIAAHDAQTLAGASYLIDWQDGSSTAASAASHTYASGGLKAILGSVTDAGGLSDFMAAAIVLVPPVTGALHPNSEVVGVAWLKARVPYLGTRVATELPTDNSSWSASGFVTIAVTGGSPNIEVGVRRPVFSIDCWGASTNSGRPPWNLASQMAEQIHDAVLAHALVPTIVSPGGAYGNARVFQVIPRTEPRRIPGDVANYAHFSFDVEMWWVEQ